MTVSCVHFLDRHGRIILGRDYRGDIDYSLHCTTFMSLLKGSQTIMTSTFHDKKEEYDDDTEEYAAPVLHHEGITYVYLTKPSFYLLAMTRRNSNVISLTLFLQRLITIFDEYFGVCDEESLRENFVVAYELLDEVMDFGFPQSTDSKALKPYVTQKSHQKVRPMAQSTLTSSVSWRPEGIKHRKNEVFLDVVESINLTVGANGQVIDSEIRGAIKVRCNLSGMPELKLGLTDRVLFEGHAATQSSGTHPSTHRHHSHTSSIELEDIRFHQCVRLEKFDAERVITFVPPDGEFHLMTYRIDIPQMKPLFWIDCKIDKWTDTVLEMTVHIRAQFKKRSSANDTRVMIPVPPDIDTPKTKATLGHASYVPAEAAMVWKIPYLPGDKEGTLHFKCGLPIIKNPTIAPSSNDELDTKRHPLGPIRVLFEIPYFTMSGMQVRYLKIVEKSGYPALPWVRYITENGEYQFRMSEDIVADKSGGRKSGNDLKPKSFSPYDK